MSEEQLQTVREDMKKEVPHCLMLGKVDTFLGSGGLWGSFTSTSENMEESIQNILVTTVQGQGSSADGLKPVKTEIVERPIEKMNPDATASAPARVDLPSLKNTAYAMQTRDLDAVVKKMNVTLTEGEEALKISKPDADQDFMAEAFVRMGIGYAWLGSQLKAENAEKTEVKVEPMNDKGAEDSLAKRHQEELVRLVSGHFQLVSSPESLESLSMIQETIASIKDMKEQEALNKLVEGIKLKKDMASELQTSINVAVKDLKKNHARRTG